MTERARVAIAGIGNNVSALVQGVYYYCALKARQPDVELPGIRRPVIDGLGVDDLEFVAGFDVTEAKVGKDLNEAIFAEPNNYLRLDVEIPTHGVVVEPGITEDGDAEMQIERVAGSLTESGAEVLLYALPAGRPWAADAYAEAALRSGVGFINTTPDVVARNSQTMQRFAAAGLPLIGDDLASHFGTSVVHKTLLNLLADRGLTLVSSYQFNLGGNQDFKNLVDHATEKRQSKLNALSTDEPTLNKVHMMPFGYVPQLHDQKVAHVNIEGLGWAGTPISLDIKLKVHDSSAAGVTIDLLRFAASARRASSSGFVEDAEGLLKSHQGQGTDALGQTTPCSRSSKLTYNLMRSIFISLTRSSSEALGGTSMVTKDQIHRLVDQIAEDDLPAVARYLEYVRDTSDPFLRALANAPEDDEPETPEEAAAVAEAKAEIARGEFDYWDDIRAELLGPRP